jgi:hypothetical protein
LQAAGLIINVVIAAVISVISLAVIPSLYDKHSGTTTVVNPSILLSTYMREISGK